MHLKKLFASAFLCTALIVGQPFAQGAADDEFDEFDDDAPQWIRYVPSTSYWGLRGLHHTVSAEPLGAGRFNISLFGSYFRQKQEIFAPGVDANVVTSRAALSWGLNDEIDVFGIVPFYFFSPADGRSTRANVGGLMGGIQFSIPMPKEQPVRLGLQALVSSGIRTGGGGAWEDRDITTNNYYMRDDDAWDNGDRPERNGNYAGYDFWDARKRDQIDLMGKLPISFVWGGLDKGFKIHLNPGLMVTPGFNDILFFLGTGLQYDITESFTGGFEFNWRTAGSKFTFEDPAWITPTIAYRSPYYSEGLFGMSVILGADICVSSAKTVTLYDNNGRPNGTDDMKPLEPWRIFGDFVFSFDRYASYRAGLEQEKRRSAAERERLRRGVQAASAERDEIARRAHEDSLRLAREMAERAHADSLRAKHIADSLAAQMGDLAERARQDSIAQAQAAAQREAELYAASAAQRAADSLALLEAQRKLEEERANRSDAEKMMLNTGMIVLGGVFFNTGRADISRNSIPYLQTIARMLVKYPKLQIEIGGHTDNTGSIATNERLSAQRAGAVVSYMVSVEPALANMLTARGYGPSMPKEDNNTAAGREANRRVELKVLNPEVLREYNP